MGLAIVPRVCVSQELAADSLVEIPVEGLDQPRQTYMVYRDKASLSAAAQQFVDVVSHFPWEAPASAPRRAASPRKARLRTPARRSARTAQRLALR